MLSRLNLKTSGRTDKVIYRAGLIVVLIISDPPIKFRNVVGTEMDKGRIHSQDLNNLNNNNRIPSYRCAALVGILARKTKPTTITDLKKHKSCNLTQLS